MRAEEALRQSKNNFIESDIRNGSAVIFQESGAASECFRLFFVPRREKEVCGLSIETVEVGVYDDLDIAITIACIGYGAYESNWKPAAQSRSDSLTEILNTIAGSIRR
jgi:hypothetical protein